MIPIDLSRSRKPRAASLLLASGLLIGSLFCQTSLARPSTGTESVEGRAPVIVQLFNWPFSRVEQELPLLKRHGYTHVFVSPANLTIGLSQWWGRYQPVDYRVIGNILGTRDEFVSMNRKADSLGMAIIADVVLNHMADPAAVRRDFGVESERSGLSYPPARIRERFGLSELFNAEQFHRENCIQDWNNREQQLTGWFCDPRSKLPDLNSLDPIVIAAQVEYLNSLVRLGVDGFRFDAIKHIDSGAITKILESVKDAGKLQLFGEIVSTGATASQDFHDYLPIERLKFYNYPLLESFAGVLNGKSSLSDLVAALANDGMFLNPSRSVTFIVNHDLPGNGDLLKIFKVGSSNEKLAYALAFGLGTGIPYVYSDLGPSAESGIDWSDYELFHRNEYLKPMIAFYQATNKHVSKVLHLEPNVAVLEHRGNGIFAINLLDHEVCVTMDPLAGVNLRQFRDLKLQGFALQQQSDGDKSICIAGRSARMLLRGKS
jgi:alpha-amylase